MGRNGEKGMTLIVKTVTKLTLGFILLYGVYIGLSGEFSPGGGFAGGVIVALSLVHVMLAFGKDVAMKRLRPTFMRVLLASAGLLFLAIVITGYRFRSGLEETVIPLCEMLMVGAGIFAIFTALVLLSKADRDAEEGK